MWLASYDPTWTRPAATATPSRPGFARGYDPEFATAIFKQIQGFSEFGFPESHAGSFALLVNASCWTKRHHPAEFLAAMLNSQPLGFYSPSQLVQDAKRHD